jgi:hypothetical protein
MSTADQTYSFELYPAELHWLAGAMAIMRLPIPGDPLHGMPASELKSQLAQGLASLRERGYVMGSPPSNWQIDRLPAAVVQWMASADRMLQVDLHEQAGTSYRANLFSSDNGSLHVVLKGNTYQITIMPHREPLTLIPFNILDDSQSIDHSNSKQFAFPQPTVILATAWRDRDLTTRMLKRTGLESAGIRSTLDWIASMKWWTEARQIQLNEAKAAIQTRIWLCGDNQHMWKGDAGITEDEIVTFSSISAQEVNTYLSGLY